MPQFSDTSRRLFLALTLIVLLGAFLRLNATLHTTVLAPLRADAGEYFSYAYNIQHYGVYSRQPTFLAPAAKYTLQPDALRSPGYSLALLPFASTPPTYKTILDITLMQAVLGIAMIPLVFFLSRGVLPGAWPLLPAFFVAISPQLVVAGTYVLSETLFTFLFLLALLAIKKQFRNPEKWGIAIASGALLAAASLTRPTLQYVLPVIIGCIFFMLPPASRIKQACALALGFLLIFAPWLMRNYLTLGVLSDSTLTISTLLHGHYPDFMYQGRPETLGYPYRFDPRAAEIGATIGTVAHEILRLFVAEPLTYLRWYFIGKPIAFFSWGDVAAAGDIFTYPTLQSPYLSNSFFTLTRNIMQVSHRFWMLLGFIATLLIWKPAFFKTENAQVKTELRLLSVVVLYFLAVHIAGFPIARYCIPLLPILFILATFALSAGATYFVETWRARG